MGEPLRYLRGKGPVVDEPSSDGGSGRKQRGIRGAGGRKPGRAAGQPIGSTAELALASADDAVDVAVGGQISGGEISVDDAAEDAFEA